MPDVRLIDVDRLIDVLMTLPDRKEIWRGEVGQPDVKPGMTLGEVIRGRLRLLVKEADLTPVNQPRHTMGDMIALIAELADTENECRFDHRGHCQEHGHLRETKCPHAKAKQLLKDFGAI